MQEILIYSQCRKLLEKNKDRKRDRNKERDRKIINKNRRREEVKNYHI
jgi:hypothetical protein